MADKQEQAFFVTAVIVEKEKEWRLHFTERGWLYHHFDWTKRDET
ncbi:MAG: hypothetical protein ACE5OZ_11550 [Candidatus Heimdallarchaeota archaeon]